MGPSPSASQGNTSVFEATTLLPSYEVSAKKVASAIADGQTASNAVLTGVPNAPSTMRDQDLKAQSTFLLRAVIAQVKHVLNTPAGESLSRTVNEVTKQTAELFRDTPKLKEQSQDATAAARRMTENLAKAIHRTLGREAVSSVQELVNSFLAKIEHSVTPPDPLQLRQADLKLAHRQLAQAVVGAAADGSNKRLLEAIVAYGRTKFEGHIPTTPREIASVLVWAQIRGIEPTVGAPDRIEAHKRIIAERTGATLREVTEAVTRFASHPEIFASEPLTSIAVSNIPVGESQLIGRLPTADLVVKDQEVSGTHLLILRTGRNDWALYDNGSTNGTTVNGSPIKPNTRIDVTSGTTVTIGGTQFVLP